MLFILKRLTILLLDLKGVLTMDNHRAKTIVFIFTICCSVIFFGLPTKSWGLDGADVGIYNDTLYGSGAWEEGIIAIKEMLVFLWF